MASIPVSRWQSDAINRRVAAKFDEAGVSSSHLLVDWSLNSDGLLTATAVLKLTPEEAAALINGEREP